MRSESCTPAGSFTDRMSGGGRKGETALITHITQIQRKNISSKEKCEIMNWGSEKANAKLTLSESLFLLSEAWVWTFLEARWGQVLVSPGKWYNVPLATFKWKGHLCLEGCQKLCMGVNVQKDRWDVPFPLTTEYSRRIRKKLTSAGMNRAERKITMFIPGHSLQGFAGDRPCESIHLHSVIGKQKMKQKSRCDSEWFQAACKGMHSTRGHQLRRPHNNRGSFNKTTVTRIQRDLEQDKQQMQNLLKRTLLINVQKFPKALCQDLKLLWIFLPALTWLQPTSAQEIPSKTEYSSR